jgi:hypothetical protein
MNEMELQSMLGWAILIGMIVFVITHYYLQQKTVSLVRLENREMNPSHVWFQLIPIVNLVWSFIVVRRIAVSIANELNSPIDDSIVGTQTEIYRLPTYPMGLLTCILMTLSWIPFPLTQVFFLLAGLVTWIIYWIQLARYRKMLKDRALIMQLAI